MSLGRHFLSIRVTQTENITEGDLRMKYFRFTDLVRMRVKTKLDFFVISV
jgi:hypothetical protein